MRSIQALLRCSFIQTLFAGNPCEWSLNTSGDNWPSRPPKISTKTPHFPSFFAFRWKRAAYSFCELSNWICWRWLFTHCTVANALFFWPMMGRGCYCNDLAMTLDVAALVGYCKSTVVFSASNSSCFLMRIKWVFCWPVDVNMRNTRAFTWYWVVEIRWTVGSTVPKKGHCEVLFQRDE